MNILAIIPARYASTRFPAKALADIAGKTMIQRVFEQTSKASGLAGVVVATDHPAIFDHVQQFGGQVVMTSESHRSGTDRCYEALQKATLEADYVINVQGDEPFIQPQQIELLADCLQNGQVEIATLIKEIASVEELTNPNSPKVIINQQNEAIYFSRHPIPYVRGVEQASWLKQHIFYRHIGIYAYRTDILAKITQLSPSALEVAESLEQLRWLENGYRIQTAKTSYESLGIDTPDDLQRALQEVSPGKI